MKDAIMKKYIKSLPALALISAGVLQGCSPWSSWRSPSDDGTPPPRSAYDIYGQLQGAGVDFNAEGLIVGDGQTVGSLGAGVTFGAEKEGSSSLISRVMGPSSEVFKTHIRGLSEENRKLFLSDFFTNYLKNANGYRTYLTEDGVRVDLAGDVKDLEGNPKAIDLERLRGVDYANASIEVLDQKFDEWLTMTEGRPYSFMKPSIRQKIFKGELPGLSGHGLKADTYTSWVAHFGLAQKYIESSHPTSKGWEILFLPQKSYGEFEEMVTWFKRELKNAGQLFEAPGHHRMVFSKNPQLPEQKLGEVYKMIQALIVIDGIQGKTGIEKASFKSVLPDSNMASLSSSRGVIRLEGSRFAPNSHSVEFRAGTKDINTSRFFHTVLASRVASNDFSGIADVGSWKLVDYSLQSDFVDRFGVSREVSDKASAVLRSVGMNTAYVVPLWGWDDPKIPFLSVNKRNLVKGLTRDFIIQLAALAPNEQSREPVRNLMRSWTKATNIGDEVRSYIRPKRNFEMTADILKFNAPEGRPLVEAGRMVDVNNIDLGIEYSGKFPLKLDADFTEDKLADGKFAWINTRIDMSIEERDETLRKIAADLAQELGVNSVPEKVGGDGHGHGLSISYAIRDAKNRKWEVEWDGVGRSYTPDGEIVGDSLRGGSVELVTPKFVPSAEEINAVYRAFEKNSILPDLLSGGGHINIDLAAFDNNPKAFARFLSIFHEHRGVISLMFQNYNRVKSAEAADVSPALARALKNFNGSEEELKKLLYNEQYFNSRFGRKTRYLQMDVSAYYQDVIPEEFISDDFDIKDPTVDWRRQFRVDPRIRKAEFRLFNAPRDPAESALQIRLVRAMLSKALNEEGELSGAVQKVDHISYMKDTSKASADLKKMCDDLGLKVDDYRPAMAEGLSDTDLISRSKFFQTVEQKVAMHPKQPAWGRAVAARSADNAISSEGRAWTPGPADRQNTMTRNELVRAAQQAEERRARIIPDRSIPGQFRRTDSCMDALAAFF
jgi:hypothetical protein